MKAALLLLVLLASPVSAQRITWDEAAGGAAFNVALRAPMAFLPKPHRGVLTRLVVFTAGSLAYETFVDPHHTMQDSVGKWTSTGQMRADIKGRQVGYLAMEAVVLGVTWIVRQVRHRD